MKFSLPGKLLSLIVVLALSVNIANAQAPEEMLNAGVVAGAATSAFSPAVGGTFGYAITASVHAGTLFGITFGSVDGESATDLVFAPYAKFFFSGNKDFRPFAMAQFAFASFSGITLAGGNATTSNTGLLGILGAEHFVNEYFGIYGAIQVVNLQFGDYEAIRVGVGGANVGVEWFFD